MTDKNIQPVTCVAIRHILEPTNQIKIGTILTMMKVRKVTRRKYVKIQLEQRKTRRNPYNFYRTEIIKQVNITITHLQNLDYTILEASAN